MAHDSFARGYTDDQISTKMRSLLDIGVDPNVLASIFGNEAVRQNFSKLCERGMNADLVFKDIAHPAWVYEHGINYFLDHGVKPESIVRSLFRPRMTDGRTILAILLPKMDVDAFIVSILPDGDKTWFLVEYYDMLFMHHTGHIFDFESPQELYKKLSITDKAEYLPELISMGCSVDVNFLAKNMPDYAVIKYADRLALHGAKVNVNKLLRYYWK